jgi:acyl-CoA synthetase (AMP-forming)/AMP-acid ligase II/acyl carrier protein
VTFSTTYQLLQAQADRAPESVAILAPGRAPLTYGRLRRQVRDVVSYLNGLGIGRNDRVAIVLPNGPEMAVAFLSVASGATSAPLNPTYRASEFDFYLSDLHAKALVVLAGMDSPAIQIARDRGITVIDLMPLKDGPAGLFDLSGTRQRLTALTGFAQPEDIALVLHTSGTTSRPKIVPLMHLNICTSARNVQAALELTCSDRCLVVMPLFHIHGLIGATLSSLVAGASIICTPGFDEHKFFAWIDTLEPTWYTAVPTMHQAVLANAAANCEIIARCPLRLIRSSSSSLPPKVMAELEDVFSAPVIESYGMTEASHQMTSNPLPPHRRKAGSVGVAAGPEVAIMDEAGHLLPPGEIGEIVIHGASVTRGYENNPAANEQSFIHGWFRTGDQGFMDADDYFFITGCLKEIINRGGEKIAPREVDEALLDHPAVAQAITFAVPHPTLGQDVAAAVVLRENAPVTERELRAFAFARLADYKVPSQVVIVDEMPKGPTGKLQRMGLAERLSWELKAAFVLPRDPLEFTLAGIWAEVLDVGQVGIYDNFFALGGDSLRATQLAARVRAAFQVELPLGMVFREPTIDGQAAVIEDLLVSEIEALIGLSSF